MHHRFWSYFGQFCCICLVYEASTGNWVLYANLNSILGGLVHWQISASSLPNLETTWMVLLSIVVPDAGQYSLRMSSRHVVGRAKSILQGM